MTYLLDHATKHAIAQLLDVYELPSGIIDARVITDRDKPAKIRIEATDDFTDTDAARTFELTIRELGEMIRANEQHRATYTVHPAPDADA